MATYLYCVWSEVVTVPEPLIGIDGAPVRSLAAAGIHAWVSAVGDGTRTPSIDRLRAHDAVCAAGMATGRTPLPVRFGQVYADDEAAVRALEHRAEALERRLDRLAGCVEMRVVVAGVNADEATGTPPDPGSHVPNAPATAARGPGTAFLERVAAAGRADIAREVQCEEIRHAVRGEGRSLIVDQVPCESARGMSYFAVLVRRDDVAAFTAVVRELLASRPAGLSVLGPFAPYSFATDA